MSFDHGEFARQEAQRQAEASRRNRLQQEQFMRTQQEQHRQFQQQQEQHRQFQQQMAANASQRARRQAEPRVHEGRGDSFAPPTGSRRGWRSDAEQEQVRDQRVSTTPRGLVPKFRRSRIGQVRGIDSHQTRTNTGTIVQFRLEAFDQDQGRLPSVPVRIRGEQAIGFAAEGEWVEMCGSVRGGRLRGRKGHNHSTGATYRSRWANLGLVAIFVAIALFVGGLYLGYRSVRDREDEFGGGRMVGAGGELPDAQGELPAAQGELPSAELPDNGGGAGGNGQPTPAPTAPASFDRGDPDSSSLPPEHQARKLGGAADRVHQEVERAQRPWQEVVGNVVGQVEGLPTEHRYEVISRSASLLASVQSCIATGDTWQTCAEADMGPVAGIPPEWTAANLAGIDAQHGTNLFAETLACVEGGQTWATCAEVAYLRWAATTTPTTPGT